MTKWVRKVWDDIASMPSTNVRIAMTLFCVFTTAGRYQVSGLGFGALHVAAWEPSGEWLTFLAAMSGIDVIQFGWKRKTHDEYVKSKINGTAAAEPKPADSGVI